MNATDASGRDASERPDIGDEGVSSRRNGDSQDWKAGADDGGGSTPGGNEEGGGRPDVGDGGVSTRNGDKHDWMAETDGSAGSMPGGKNEGGTWADVGDESVATRNGNNHESKAGIEDGAWSTLGGNEEGVGRPDKGDKVVSTRNSDNHDLKAATDDGTGLPPGGNDDSGGRWDGRGDDDNESGRSVARDEEKETILARTRTILDTEMTNFATRVSELSTSIGEAAASVLTALPAQVTVAMIGVVTAFFGARAQERRERRRKAEAEAEAESRARAARVAEVRENYRGMQACMLKAAHGLAQRLAQVAEGGGGEGGADAALYTTYLLARYLASVELLKTQNSAINLGMPAADRIFANILGRVQGALAAAEPDLAVLQQSERLFKRAPVPGGPLRVPPRVQANVGKLLLRAHWERRDHGASMNAILSYVEFCELYDTKPVVRRWCAPVHDAFLQVQRQRRRGRHAGARLYVAQAALLDLVDFLDPPPKCRFVPLDARRRLRLGAAAYDEELRMPPSVQSIYRALGALRDGVGADAVLRMHREMRDAPLEVYVKAPEGGDGALDAMELGDCPYSQSVLLLLEECGIRYRAIRIRNDDKPAWYHLINPQVSTPVVYHEGHLVSDSRAIEMYLTERFGDDALPSSVHRERRTVGSRRFTRFHGVFLRWLAGDDGAKATLEREMKGLEVVLDEVARRNEEGVFFGGARFSREDIAIAPFLYHTVVAGRELKQWCMPDKCPAVARYVEELMNVESFQKTRAQRKAIVDGYGRVMREGKDRELKLMVALE